MATWVCRQRKNLQRGVLNSVSSNLAVAYAKHDTVNAEGVIQPPKGQINIKEMVRPLKRPQATVEIFKKHMKW